MTISSTLFWTLIGTVLFALVIMISSIVWMYFRRKKIIKTYKGKEPATKFSPVKIRENSGQLLWELKSKIKKPLDDYQMEFAINSVYRNSYKKFSTVGFETDYEKESLQKLGKSKYDENTYDFLMINGNIQNLNNEFDEKYKILKKNQMILIANASRKNKEIKRLLTYLKTIKAKYDWSKYGKGVLVVVK